MNSKAEDFLSQYSEGVFKNALLLREVLFSILPDIKEELDIPAKMLAYMYGRKYSELICVIIPSKKGLKLGFNRGIDLPDPKGLLEGTGKVSRYLVIESEKQIKSAALKKLIKDAYKLYLQKMLD